MSFMAVDSPAKDRNNAVSVVRDVEARLRRLGPKGMESEGAIRRALLELWGVDMSREILAQTKIPKAIKQLRKNWSKRNVTLSKSLIQYWLEVYKGRPPTFAKNTGPTRRSVAAPPRQRPKRMRKDLQQGNSVCCRLTKRARSDPTAKRSIRASSTLSPAQNSLPSTPRRAGGPAPTLLSLCVSALVRNAPQMLRRGGGMIGRLGEIPQRFVQRAFAQCTPTQLRKIEKRHPILARDTDPLWKRHCAEAFGVASRDEFPRGASGWRDAYQRLDDTENREVTGVVRHMQRERDAKLKERRKSMKVSMVDVQRNEQRNARREKRRTTKRSTARDRVRKMFRHNT